MMRDEAFTVHEDGADEDSHPNFDFLSLLSKPKNYYKILEVNYDASEDEIRSNFIRLALKWHPDKQKGEDDVTSKFQEINEAYQVLSDPVRKMEYDKKGMLHVYDYNIMGVSGVGVSEPLQGTYIDMQRLGDSTIYLVKDRQDKIRVSGR